MNRIVAIFATLAVVLATLALPAGAVPEGMTELAASDCSTPCGCDTPGMGCGEAIACAAQCAFVTAAVLPSAVPARRAAQASVLQAAPYELTALFIRPPLPPPQA